MRHLRTDERGSALAFTAVVLVGVMAMLALAVDLGMLYEARGQAQRTADATALAGAAALIDYGNDPGVEDRVYEYASVYLAENPVGGEPASMEPSDVVVDLANWRVTVTVHRTADRGNPVPTLFGRIVGVDEADVNAVATAEAAEAGGVNCLLPLAIPDRWLAEGGVPDTDGTFDPDENDYYIPQPQAGATGYTAADIGTPIILKPFQTTGRLNSSWWYPWRPPGQQGGDDYRENIVSCNDPTMILGAGSCVDTEPGAMIGPTKQGFQDLIDMDPDAYWNDTEECVARPAPGGPCIHLSASKPFSERIRPAPMFDPTVAPDPGAKPFCFTNFASIFVDRIEGNEVHAVFLGLAGAGPGGGGGGITAGPAVRFVRLIQ